MRKPVFLAGALLWTSRRDNGPGRAAHSRSRDIDRSRQPKNSAQEASAHSIDPSRKRRLKVRTASYDNSSAAEGEVEGYVSDFFGAASAFRVAGYPVRLASAVVYEDGVATDLKNDIRVEAKGRIDNGVLVVTKLEFKSRDENGDGNDDNVSSGSQEFEFKGTAACVSCGATSGTFTIKGVTVSYDASTEFRDGLSGATLNGRAVEVRSLGQVTSTGTTYRATRIEPDN